MWIRDSLLCSRVKDPQKRKTALEIKLSRSKGHIVGAKVATAFSILLFAFEIIFQHNLRPAVLVFFATVVTYIYIRIAKMQEDELAELQQERLTSLGEQERC